MVSRPMLSSYKKELTQHYVNKPWKRLKLLNYSIDYVDQNCNNMKNSAIEGKYPLVVHKNSWLHLDLFSKHCDSYIGFGFLTGPDFAPKRVLHLPLLNLKPPLKTPLKFFTHTYTLPISSYHTIDNRTSNVTSCYIAASRLVRWSLIKSILCFLTLAPQKH